MGADPPRASNLIDEKGSREIGNLAEAHAGVVEQAEVAVGHFGPLLGAGNRFVRSPRQDRPAPTLSVCGSPARWRW